VADPTQALLEKLKRNPRDPEAFSNLRVHYGRVGDYTSLIALLEHWAQNNGEDRVSSAHTYFEAADLAQSYLRDGKLSRRLYELAVERDPTHLQASQRLEQIYLAAADFRALVALLENRLQEATRQNIDPRLIAAMHYQLGTLLEQKLDQSEQAILHYRRAFELNPEFIHAIYSARMIYQRANNFRAAVPLYEAEIRIEQDPARRAALLRELSAMQATQLGDISSATHTLEQAAQLYPQDLGIKQDLSQLLVMRASSRPGSRESQSDLHRVAQLLLDLGIRAEARESLAYFNQVLDIMPGHEEALQRLEHIAFQLGQTANLPGRWVAFLTANPHAPSSFDVRRRLAQAYVDNEQFVDAIVCLEPLSAAGDPQVAGELAALYQRTGQHTEAMAALRKAIAVLPPKHQIPKLQSFLQGYLAINEQEYALACVREILKIDPGDPEALAFYDETCRARGAYAELRDVLLAAARIPGLPVRTRRHRLNEVAAISEHKLNEPTAALAAWKSLYNLDPTDTEAFSNYRRLLNSLEAWQELVQLLEREMLSSSYPESKFANCWEVGEIYLERLNDVGRALPYLRQANHIDPDHVRVQDLLADALVQSESFLEAIPLLRSRLVREQGDVRLQLMRLLVRILMDKAGDDEGAYILCLEILDERPGDIETLDRMQQIDVQLGRIDKLLQTLAYRLDVAPQDARSAILLQMGSIADNHLHDAERAAEYYIQAFDSAADPLQAIDPLRALMLREHRYRDLLGVYKKRLNTTSDLEMKVFLQREIARILQDHVRNEDAAAEAWRALVDWAEDEEALLALCTYAARRDLDHDRVGWLRRLIPLLQDTTTRRERAMELASVLAGRLDDKRGALRTLESILEGGGAGDIAALRYLCALYEALGDLEGLAAGLERLVLATVDKGLKVPILQALQALYHEKLKDSVRVIRTLKTWCSIDPEDPVPWRMLCELYEQTSAYPELVQSLQRMIRLTPDATYQLDLQLKTAKVLAQHLDDVDAAWSILEPLASAENERALTALYDLAKEKGRAEELAQLYQHYALQHPDGRARARFTLRTSDVLSELCGDPARALDNLLAITHLPSPNDESKWLERADELAEKSGEWAKLARLYHAILENERSPEFQQGMLLRLSHVIVDGEGDNDLAFTNVRAAWSLSPDNGDVTTFLEDLAVKTGRVGEVLKSFDTYLTTQDETVRTIYRIRAALLCLRADSFRDKGEKLLNGLIDMTIDQGESLDALEQKVVDLEKSQQVKGATSKVIQRYKELASDVSLDGDSAANLMLRVARLSDEVLNDRQAGLLAYQEAVSLAPVATGLLNSYVTFAKQHAEFDALNEGLRELERQAMDTDLTVAILRERAHLLEDHFASYSEAADVYTKLLSLAPDDRVSYGHLKACLHQARRYQDLLVVLHQGLERAQDQQERLTLWKEEARLWEENLGNRHEAIASWRRVLKADPRDVHAELRLEQLEQEKEMAEISQVDISIPAHFAEIEVHEETEEQPREETFAAPPRLAKAQPAKKETRAKPKAKRKRAPRAQKPKDGTS